MELAYSDGSLSTESDSAPSLMSSTSSSTSTKASSHCVENEDWDLDNNDDSNDEWDDIPLLGAHLFWGTPSHITASYIRQRLTLDTLMGNMRQFELSFHMNLESMQALYAVIADRLHRDEGPAIQ
eukprot:3919817-Rhodomonas_salina.2